MIQGIQSMPGPLTGQATGPAPGLMPGLVADLGGEAAMDGAAPAIFAAIVAQFAQTAIAGHAAPTTGRAETSELDADSAPDGDMPDGEDSLAADGAVPGLSAPILTLPILGQQVLPMPAPVDPPATPASPVVAMTAPAIATAPAPLRLAGEAARVEPAPSTAVASVVQTVAAPATATPGEMPVAAVPDPGPADPAIPAIAVVADSAPADPPAASPHPQEASVAAPAPAASPPALAALPAAVPGEARVSRRAFVGAADDRAPDRAAPAAVEGGHGLVLDLVSKLDVAAPLAAPVSPDAVPAPTAGLDPASAATEPAISDLAVDRQLDMARDGQWLDQLARDIAMTADREGQLRFRLNPDHLGSLAVEVRQTAEGAAIRMTADTDAARQIIADAQPKLVAEARAQGLRIAGAQVDVGQHHQPRQQHQEPGDPAPQLRAIRGDGDAAQGAAAVTVNERIAATRDRYA